MNNESAYLKAIHEILSRLDERTSKVEAMMEEYRKIYAQVDEMELPLAGTKEEKDCFRLFSNGKQCRRRQKIIADCLEKIYTQTLMMLNSCEIDYNNPPARSKTVVSVNEVPLGTYDNLFCITGFPFLLYF